MDFISEEDTREALKELKVGKSTGKVDFTPEMKIGIRGQ